VANPILVGSHVSAAGGLHQAIERGQSIGATTIQIFTKSNRQWFDKKITHEEAALFKKTWQGSTIKEIVVHAAYLINLGSSNPDVEEKSIKALTDEVNRCAQLGIRYLVLHPGSHLGAGIQPCLAQVARNIDTVHKNTNSDVMILLETMAGQGSNIGFTFEQLHMVHTLVGDKKRLGFCVDTCHIFCAGYALGTADDWHKIVTDLDAIVGLGNVKAIHVNDSQTPCGSNKDRHAPLGTGHIPLAIFKSMMQDARLAAIPKILETPSDPEMKLWASEIALLKSYV
jgi:apurinic endonuclease APN1